jgi:predicted methyltransferase
MFAPFVRPLINQAYGIVLDIGPASGLWMPEFGKMAAEGRLTKVYGIEPNKLFHTELREQVKTYGLEDVYEPVAGYIQELEARGVKKGTVDTIITVHVLCSVGKQTEGLVKELYEYLKPGGQWIVYEHVGSKNTLTRAWQGERRIEYRNLGPWLIRSMFRALRHRLVRDLRRLCAVAEH